MAQLVPGWGPREEAKGTGEGWCHREASARETVISDPAAISTSLVQQERTQLCQLFFQPAMLTAEATCSTQGSLPPGRQHPRATQPGDSAGQSRARAGGFGPRWRSPETQAGPCFTPTSFKSLQGSPSSPSHESASQWG